MVRYGPCSVTATAVSLVKLTTCKLLNIPQGRVLAHPYFICTPNRAKFEIVHPSIPDVMTNQSLVDLRQQIDKEVNRMIRGSLNIKQYKNLKLNEMLQHFGPDVIDRYYDINESLFADWLFANYEDIIGEPIWTNNFEKDSSKLFHRRFTTVDGIEFDMRESVKQFLNEVNGNELDLIPERMKKFYMRRKNWMKHNNINNANNWDDSISKEEEMSLVMDRRWTHRMGMFDFVSGTEYNESTMENLRFNAFEIDDLGCGLVLPNAPSRSWNSVNIQMPSTYLENTAELGKIVVFQIRFRGKNKGRKLIFNLDVFPGYNSEVLGPNPYFMLREAFNIKHVASIVPTDHQLHIPKVTTPIELTQTRAQVAE